MACGSPLGPLAAVLVLLAAGDPATAAETTFSDGDFDPASWTFIEIDTNEGGTVSSEVVTDGHPGSALRITVTIDPAPAFSQITGVWLWHTPYDPAASGGFASVDYAEEARAFQITGNGHATGIAMRQEGSLFTHRVDFTPEHDWTPKRASGLVPTAFVRLAGSRPSLDFSDTAPPIEVGFYRATSHPATGGGSGTRIADIDNWRVTLVPPCAVDADCDDGDGCTVDACTDTICTRTPLDCDDGDACTDDVCTDGACTNPPRSCDDGNDCTADSCANGICQYTLATTFDIVDARLTDLLARIETSPCGQEELVRKVVRKLKNRIAGARKRLAKADRATRDKKVLKLVAKAKTLLGKARTFLGVAVERNLISTACAGTLGGLLGEVEYCIAGLPLPAS